MKKILLSLLAFLVMSPCFASTLVVYPDAGSGGDSTDSRLYRGAVDESFANIIANAGSASQPTSTNAWGVQIYGSATTNQWAYNARSIFTFLTSALTTDATLSNSTISIWGIDARNTVGADTFNIVAATPNSDTTIVAADYGTLGADASMSVAYASFSTTGYNNVTISGTNLNIIDKTGVSTFGAIGGYDLAESYTGGSWGDASWSGFSFYYADDGGAGTTHDPKLTVNYTLPAGDTGAFLNFMD